MQKILNEQKVRLVNLAESISQKGLNPMDRLLVLRSSRQGKFVIVEGNRRLLALKLLKNPSLIDDLAMPAAYRKRLQKASKDFDVKKIEPLDCFEVVDRAQGNDWIMQRHNGEDSGRGIVDWSRIAKARFRGRDPALQALDFVLEHAELSDEQRDEITGKFPLTTLERLLSTPSVRTAIGFQIDDGKLLTELPPTEAIKPLRRIVLDLVENRKDFNVSNLKSKGQQEEYIGKLKAADRPNLAEKTGTAVAVETMSEKDFLPVQVSMPRRPRGPRPSARHSIVPKGCGLNVSTPKIAGIYAELKSLQLSRHVHAIAVLLRVFLEMSVDEYLVTTAGSSLKFKHPKDGSFHDKTLRQKVEETVAHLVSQGADKKDFLGVTRGLTDVNHPFSIDTLHAYIHNRFFTPVDTHLTTAWDNAQPFFEKLWP
jgi:hypothetical protein